MKEKLKAEVKEELKPKLDLQLFLNLFLLGFVLVGGATSSGCKSTNNLSETKAQTQHKAITAEVLLKALEKDSNSLAEFLSSMPDSGAVGWTKRKSVIRDSKGEPVLDKEGNVQFAEQESIGKSNSMRDLAAVDSVILVLGGVALNKNGEAHADSSLTGLSIIMSGTKIGSTVSPDFARAFNERIIGEKQATAEGVKKALEAKKGLYMEVINSTGKAVAGILKEVKDVTPYGASSAIADVVLGDKDTGELLQEKVEIPLVK